MSRTNSLSYFYVGSYTPQDLPPSLYYCALNSEDGSLALLRVSDGGINPSFLTLSSDGRRLYAVNETQQFAGQAGGSVVAFAVEPQTGQLRLLSQQPTNGADPCYVTLDRRERYVAVTNYNGGNLAVYPLGEDGALLPASWIVAEQSADTPSHPHTIQFSAQNDCAYVCNLGLNTLSVYHFSADSGQLQRQQTVHLPDGAGPRHLAQHPTLKRFYVLTEASAEIVPFFHNSAGEWEQGRPISCLPLHFSGQNASAEIAIHPHGTHLYASNRGQESDNLAIFQLDPEGELQPIGHIPTEGAWPRHFAIDPSGRYCIVANQNSDQLVCFPINAHTGMLDQACSRLNLPKPCCVCFIPVR